MQGPLLRIFQDFPVCISLVYTEEMEVRKEKRRKGRLEYRTPYAMRRHKAWRGGSNSAAKLRSRHRAKNESDKVSKSWRSGRNQIRERSGGDFSRFLVVF